jgi:hypothetical protein
VHFEEMLGGCGAALMTTCTSSMLHKDETIDIKVAVTVCIMIRVGRVCWLGGGQYFENDCRTGQAGPTLEHDHVNT